MSGIPFSGVFHLYVAGFLAVVLLAAWVTGRARKRAALEARRHVPCPLCGAVANPRPRAARVRCRACGVRFHTGAAS